MLTNIFLEDFKCFERLRLPVAMLTVLTGYNAAGKSSSLQGLLLPAQGVRQRRWQKALYANGPLVELGTGIELLREGADSTNFALGVEHSSGEALRWRLRPSDDDIGRLASETSVKHANAVSYLPLEGDFKTSVLLPMLRDTMYVSADRDTQRDFHPAPDFRSPGAAPDVGVRGEFAAWNLYKYGDDKDVDVERFAKEDKAPLLRKQVNAWASYLFGFAEFNARRPTLSKQVWLELRTSEISAWRRSANIGFGLSYAFPVLIAGLLAEKGQILVVDSPEAHLHPLAQSRMGYFLACMSHAGVQVIIESHSDHVLNGVRLAVKARAALPEEIVVHFFGSRLTSSGRANEVITPVMDASGALSHWPAGFFDQAEQDLARLAGWR